MAYAQLELRAPPTWTSVLQMRVRISNQEPITEKKVSSLKSSKTIMSVHAYHNTYVLAATVIGSGCKRYAILNIRQTSDNRNFLNCESSDNKVDQMLIKDALQNCHYYPMRFSS